MAWFQRGKDVEPTSLEQYYADQHNHSPMAWLLALAAFLATLVLVFGVFWGGRWIYRKTTHKDTSISVTQGNARDPFANANIDQPNSTETKPTSQSQGVVNAPTNSGSISTSIQSTPTSSTTAQNSKQITNTGPGSQLVIFLSVTATAALLYQLRIRYKALS